MRAQAKSIVFVIDDDDAVRDSLCALLESAGLDATAYPSAQSFLDEFKAGVAGCIILDLNMPGMTGFEMLAALRQRDSTIPVIFFSAAVDEALAPAARAAGAHAVLTKPADDDQLITLVNAALHGRSV